MPRSVNLQTFAASTYVVLRLLLRWNAELKNPDSKQAAGHVLQQFLEAGLRGAEREWLIDTVWEP
eukprot:2486597-Lingulodinium_polyedra.AAC.1